PGRRRRGARTHAERRAKQRDRLLPHGFDKDSGQCYPIPANSTIAPIFPPGDQRMRRFALMLFAGVPSVLAAQGFAVSEHNTCTMGRAGVSAANPCADGSAIYFSPAGLAGLAGRHLSSSGPLLAPPASPTDD